MSQRLYTTLTILVVFCVLVVGLMYANSNTENRDTIRLEVAKTFLQLMAIGVLGALVKWLFDQHTLARSRADALNEFRKEILRRLISVTNEVRKVPLLIESAQSAKTYGEQMRSLIDSRLELSFIRHELDTANQTFSNSSEVRAHLRTMELYLDELIDEFKDEYRNLSKKQTEKPEVVWSEIQKLPKLSDLQRGGEDSDYRTRYVLSYSSARDLMRQEIWVAVGVKRRAMDGE